MSRARPYPLCNQTGPVSRIATTRDAASSRNERERRIVAPPMLTVGSQTRVRLGGAAVHFEQAVRFEDAVRFEEVWALADRVPGWLTEAQARVLWSAGTALHQGADVVEIGSHQGRSTIVLGAAAARCGGRLTAVDPFDPSWRYGGPDTERRLRSHLAEAGISGAVEVRPVTSQELLRQWDRPLDLVYVDGKHDYWSVRHDLGWAGRLVPGGRLMVHDAFSSLGVTFGLLAHTSLRSDLVYVSRTGSLAVLVRRAPTVRDRARPWRELPWFARNLTVKLLLRLRQRRLARLLGHRGAADPY